MFMSIISKTSVAPGNTLSITDVAQFCEQVNIGDVIQAVIHVKKWTSSTSFNWVPKLATVTVLRKYPHLVETDQGIFPWNDFAYGFCHMVCSAGKVKENSKLENVA